MVRLAAVLGSPVRHSLSPALHAAAYRALGLDWDYTAVECDEAGLPALLSAVRADPNWVGLSLTMPLKRAVLPLLDEVDPAAAVLGAVNTVTVRDGRLAGFNTDVEGIAGALAAVAPAAAAPLVLGMGGTARAALAALAQAARRGGGRRVVLAVRRPETARPLVEIGARLGLALEVRLWPPPRPGWAGGADVVVATTPAGATDLLAAPPWPARCALVELLYDPWPTALAATAQAAGAPVAGGLDVLAGQAVGQVRLFTAAAGTDVTGRGGAGGTVAGDATAGLPTRRPSAPLPTRGAGRRAGAGAVDGPVTVELLRAAGRAELARRAGVPRGLGGLDGLDRPGGRGGLGGPGGRDGLDGLGGFGAAGGSAGHGRPGAPSRGTGVGPGTDVGPGWDAGGPGRRQFPRGRGGGSERRGGGM